MSVLIRSNPSVYLHCPLRNLGLRARSLLRPPCKPASCASASGSSCSSPGALVISLLASNLGLRARPLLRPTLQACPLCLCLLFFLWRIRSLVASDCLRKFDAYAPCCLQP